MWSNLHYTYCIFLKLVMKHRSTSVGIKTFFCNRASQMNFLQWIIICRTCLIYKYKNIYSLLSIVEGFCQKCLWLYLSTLSLKKYWWIGSCKIFVKLNIHIIKITNNFTRYSHTKDLDELLMRYKCHAYRISNFSLA